jgi:hypothetical protein
MKSDDVKLYVEGLTPEKVLDFKVKVGGMSHRHNLATELSIDRKNINDNMSKQPSQYAWFAVLHALANDAYERLKAEKKSLYAEKDNRVRARAAKLGEKTTEKGIEQAIELDPEYMELSEHILEAKLNVDLLQAALIAFMQRKDMLISISSNMRAEMDTDLSILKSKAKDVMHSKEKH